MKCNVAWWDRGLRLVIGMLILVQGILSGAWWGLIGLVIFATGLMGVCLLYKPFGINTCKNSPDNESD